MKTSETATNCRRIGVDFHGVINHDPLFFRAFCAHALQNGDELFIISGGPREYIARYLSENKIPYTHLWCILDECIRRDIVTFYPDGSFFVDHTIWNEAKGIYCRQNKIGLHIDDCEIYGLSFTTPFCLYQARSREFIIEHHHISAEQGADKVYADLIKYCR